MSGLPREVIKWVQSLDLSYSVKNPKRAFNNGFLIAEIFSRYFPSDIQMHSYDFGENMHKKRDNWKQLMTFFKRRGLPIIIKDVDSLILNENNSTIEFVKQVYTLLTERALMPPIKVYDTDNQEQQSLLLKEREMVKLPQNDLDVFEQDHDETKQEQSMMKESTSRSPQKSLAITKGPQRTIPQTLELDSYKAVEVKEIQIKTINQSVAQIRAHKELASLHSQNQKMQSSEVQSQMNMSHNGSQNMLGDGASRILSAETMKEEKQVRKSITDVLHEMILAKNENDENNEFSMIRVEGDMVTAFFDNIHKFSDEFTHAFIEDMENDLESLTNVIYNHVNELTVFYTYMVFMLRRLSHLSNSFHACLQFCKQFARNIVNDSDSPREEFSDFFVSHLFRAYLQIAKEDIEKREFIAELIYAHTSYDLSVRIKIVQDLKTHLKQEEVLYSMLSHLVAQEESFNEEWFDVFLYYALVGICKPRPTIRTYSLKILNVISRYNAEGILDVSAKVKALSTTHHNELKEQCLIFANNILKYLEAYSYLMKPAKEESKADTGNNLQATNARAGTQAKGPNIDLNYAKQLIGENLETKNNCASLQFNRNIEQPMNEMPEVDPMEEAEGEYEEEEGLASPDEVPVDEGEYHE